MVGLRDALFAALSFQESGRHAEADELYARILDAVPEQPDALHLWGILAAQTGRLDVANDRIRRAIAQRADVADYHANLGNVLRELGRTGEATVCYRTALTLRPDDAQSVEQLGMALQMQGRLGAAADAHRALTRLRPDDQEAHYRLGVALQGEGRFAEAAEAFRSSLTLRPDRPESWFKLGASLQAHGCFDEAAAAYRGALSLQPDFVEAGFNLGVTLRRHGHLNHAIAAFRAAARLQPGDADALCTLGDALMERGRAEDALAVYRDVLALRPDLPQVHTGLGNALLERNRGAEAVARFRIAVALRPDDAGACNNLGIALIEQGLPDRADLAYRRALRLKPDYAEALGNLGIALKEQRRVAEALAAYRRALALAPAYAEAHWNHGIALLLQGNLRQGWDEHEWRWKCREFTKANWRLNRPVWSGEAAQGKTILLQAEQGLGDTIQFVRYVPMVQALGWTVVLEVQDSLLGLFGSMPGVTLIPKGQPLPHVDACCPLLSLPRALGTTLDRVPATVPYLSTDPARVAHWKERLGQGPEPRVGLVWAGNPQFPGDRQRSPRLEGLRAALDVPGVRFFGLQKGPGREDLERVPLPASFTDLGPEIRDFADTAAIMENLDLVISSCTGPAHLAGALGRPVWLVLKAVPDWRWLLDRDDSPWYPTMRLFRQSKAGDWASVSERIASELARLRSVLSRLC
ncbi:tetratricopeptide repeat protein [Azospirillum sp. sgz302134]